MAEKQSSRRKPSLAEVVATSFPQRTNTGRLVDTVVADLGGVDPALAADTLDLVRTICALARATHRAAVAAAVPGKGKGGSRGTAAARKRLVLATMAVLDAKPETRRVLATARFLDAVVADAERMNLAAAIAGAHWHAEDPLTRALSGDPPALAKLVEAWRSKKAGVKADAGRGKYVLLHAVLKRYGVTLSLGNVKKIVVASR